MAEKNKSRLPSLRIHVRAAVMLVLPTVMCLHAVLLILSGANPRITESSTAVENFGLAVVAPTNTTRKTLKIVDASGESPFDYRPLANLKLVVFYNIFVPPDGDDKAVSYAENIIEEQLGQIGESYSVSKGMISLFYNNIGKPLEPDFMDRVCTKNKLSCEGQHHEKGYEELTLQRVHDFCNWHDDYLVMYIHSKGSYHSWTNVDFSQDSWRRNMMSAVTSKDCIKPPDPTCNVCGLVALPWAHLHFAGNFFTAQCSYIKKLIPSVEFADRVGEVLSEARVRVLEKAFTANLFPPVAHYYGAGRFAAEHWVGSHPSVRPCDLSTEPAIKPWFAPGPPQHELQFAMFPRHNIHAEWPYVAKRKLSQASTNKKIGRQEYFLLAGNLFRWMMLYGESPPENSWVWTWFPEGEMWRKQVELHGQQGIDMILSSLQG